MVDFAKRARATDDIEPDEEVLAAVNVTPSPFAVANPGLVGGTIAGGLAGGAIGAAWDSRRRKKDQHDEATKPLPEVASRQPLDTTIPANGALLAVTTKRLVLWRISAMGKPKAILASVPLTDVDEVTWEDADTKWMSGKPASLLLWVGVSDRVLPMAAISLGAAGKYARRVVEAFEQRLPGAVHRFES